MTEPIINRWYRSTIDPQVMGKVIDITPGLVTVRLSGGRLDKPTHAEFADSWEREDTH